MARSHTIAWLALGAALSVSAGARAGNGVKARVPVVWEDVPCMIVVDRTLEPLLNLPYTIPYEDPARGEVRGPDELPDSRTHQFFAFTREEDLQHYLPRWITQADIAAHAALNPAWDPMEIDPEDVFETSTVWAADEWLRIVADDDRRAIAFDVASQGVDWDTGAVPVGTYHVQGYTFEPIFNVFVRRPGVVKVTDGGEPAEYEPAIAFDPTEELILYEGDGAMFTGCVDAMPGTLLTAEWAPADAEIGTGWIAFVSDLPARGDTFALEFVAPTDFPGVQVMLRITARDPMAREYTAHHTSLVTVIDPADPNGCDTFGDTGCSDSGGSAGESATSADSSDTASTVTSGIGSDDTTAAADGGEDGPRGCSCTSAPRPGESVLACVFVLQLARRRRPRRAIGA